MRVGSLVVGIAVGLGAERLTLRRYRGSDVDDRETRFFGQPDERLDHRIETDDGGIMRVLELGDGPPVVMLHGVTLHAEIWHHQAKLADGHRLFAVDLRSHGESTPGSTGSTIGANARDLVTLLEHFDMRDAVIVGHSMGGMVLGRFLVDHPTVWARRVGAVGFISSAGRNPSMFPAAVLGPATRRLHSLAEAFPRLARQVGKVPPSDFGEMAVRSTFGDTADPDDVRDAALAFESLPPERLLEITPSILHHNVLDRLDHVDLPAGVLVGSRDQLTEVGESERLVAALPNGWLEVLDDAGHQLMLERPEDVNDFIVDLVRRAGS